MWAPEDGIPVARCPYHVHRDIDLTTGLALTPACRSQRPYETRSFIVWPARLRRWLRDHHRRSPQPPSYAPNCTPLASRRPPTIVSPPAWHTILLIPGVSPTRQQVPLEADSPVAQALSWFVDGEFLATIPADERFWWQPSPGTHEVRVIDDAMLSTARTVVVAMGDGRRSASPR